MRALLFSLLFLRSLALADSYGVSDFVHQFEGAHLKSFLETPAGERSEIKAHTAVQFLQAELPQLADENRLLPIPKPATASQDAFLDLRAQFIRILENTEKGGEIKWADENPAVRLYWSNNGSHFPSFANTELHDSRLKFIDSRTVKPSSVIHFEGHAAPPLSKFSRSWSIWHEISAFAKTKPLSHLLMESKISHQNTVTLRLKSTTLNRELISVVSDKFKIFPAFTDFASMKILGALTRAKLRF